MQLARFLIYIWNSILVTGALCLLLVVILFSVSPFYDSVNTYLFQPIRRAEYYLGIIPPVQVKVSCTLDQLSAKAYLEDALRKWEQETGKKAVADCGPENTTARYHDLETLLTHRKPDFDIIQVDLPWIPALANHLAPLQICGQERQGTLLARFIQMVRGDYGCLDPNISRDTFGVMIESSKSVAHYDSFIGVPWYVDVGLIYYRADILKRYNNDEELRSKLEQMRPNESSKGTLDLRPRNLDELTKIATLIQERERNRTGKEIWGFVWQGANKYEGLVCNILEWLDQYGIRFSNSGIEVYDDGPSGPVGISQTNFTYLIHDKLKRLVDQVSLWIDDGKKFDCTSGDGTTGCSALHASGISPPDVLMYTEADSLNEFLAGKAIFMRHWSTAWNVIPEDRRTENGANMVNKGNVGVWSFSRDVANPQSKGSPKVYSSSLGGWILAVSKYSNNPQDSKELLAFLAKEEMQVLRGDRFPPTSPSLLHKEWFGINEKLKENGIDLQDVVNYSIQRPSMLFDSQYELLSSAMSNAVHEAIWNGYKERKYKNRSETQLDSACRCPVPPLAVPRSWPGRENLCRALNSVFQLHNREIWNTYRDIRDRESDSIMAKTRASVEVVQTGNLDNIKFYDNDVAKVIRELCGTQDGNEK